MNKLKIIFFLIVLNCRAVSGYSTTGDTLYINPNPFDSLTVIHFDIVQKDTVSLQVYNRYGNIVATYFQNTYLTSGSYAVNFLADTLPNGQYHVILKLNSITISKQIIKMGAISGISNNETGKSKVILFPNPTTNTIEIPIDGIKTIIITDLTGKIIMDLTSDVKSVSLLELKRGDYIITILSEKKELILTQKIVKI